VSAALVSPDEADELLFWFAAYQSLHPHRGVPEFATELADKLRVIAGVS
jgi:hypothetical protein